MQGGLCDVYMLSDLLLADALWPSPCLLVLMVCRLQVPNVTYSCSSSPALCMVPCFFVLMQHLTCCSTCLLLLCCGAELDHQCATQNLYARVVKLQRGT